MTGPEFSGVDIDLLADYVGGALDGTPDEARVAALIADDPSWRDAHALLTEGVAAVSAGLQSWGATPEPMPADVIARLDAAFLDVATPVEAGATVTPIGSARSEDGAAADRRRVAVPSKKLKRRLRWAAPIGVAAGVIAFLGFNVELQLSDSTDQANTSAGSAADQPASDQSAPRAAAGQELSVPGGVTKISETGTDYDSRTLAQVGARTMAAPGLPEEDAGGVRKGASPTAGVMAQADGSLDRLRLPEALRACIEAIAAESRLAPITAQAVDYARYDGEPAVLVQFTATGGSWVWAVGPGCGTTGVGADKLEAVQVG